MRWSIGKRIFVAFSLASLIIVGLSAAANRWNFQRGFVDYLTQQEVERLQDIVTQLESLYAQRQSWDDLRGNERRWNDLFRDTNGEGRRPPPPRGERRGSGDRRGPARGGPPDLLALLPRVALLDSQGEAVAGHISAKDRARHVDLLFDESVVGSLLVAARPRLTDKLNLSFAKAQTRSTIIFGAMILAIAGLLAALLARQMKQPIVDLARATRALTQGRFDQRITVVRNDELGDLAADFNQLVDSLQQNQQTRRQWASDISHELRTPLAILNGELQALEDGVRQFDDGTRASLQTEVQRLSKLVNDLHELTVSDEGGASYRRDNIDLGRLTKDCLEAFATRLHDAGIKLRTELTQDALTVCGDERKLTQLVSNILENAVRYTRAPGQLLATASCDDHTIKLTFSDSAPGVAEQHLSRLFERLYRTDDSRNRTTGGSGLGLAICETICKAHGGSIKAKQSELGGVTIEVTLPRSSADETMQ